MSDGDAATSTALGPQRDGNVGVRGAADAAANSAGGAGDASAPTGGARDAALGATADAMARDGGGASVSQFPVGVSDDHRHFVDGHGKPCFWLGDTEWQLFLSFKLADAQSLLDDRRDKGFNAIQVMLFGVGGGKLANVDGAKPFLNDDPSTPNEAYFLAVDAIVKAAEQRNIALVIGVYHQARDYSTLITINNARIWAKWLGARYRSAANVIWSMYPQPQSSYVPIVRELAAGLAEGDGGRHMITVHPDLGVVSSNWINNEPWLSFNTIQSGSSGLLNYTLVTTNYALVPIKPAVDGEARYEAASGTTPLMVRNGAYYAVLAGGFYSYGHGSNVTSPATWKSWIDSPAARQMKIMGNLFATLDWWTLKPDQSVISGAPGGSVAARAVSRLWAIVYLPAPGSVVIDLATLSAAAGVEASWTDPSTGVSQSAGTFVAAGTQAFASPNGWADALLLLRAK